MVDGQEMMESLAGSEYTTQAEKQHIKKKLKTIKKEKKKGNEATAKRHANELLNFLGWDDGF
jgi:hypothetical protein